MHYLESLNEKQREAVIHTQGPLLIVAGAGTGKTKTLTHRIFHLIQKGISPEKILAITFTNKAASEMRERVHALLPEYYTVMPFISTFHSLGVYLLKQSAHALGISRHFTILDSADSLSVIKESMELLGYDPKLVDPKKIRGMISHAKGKGWNPDSFRTESHSHNTDIASSVWRAYEDILKKRNCFDFDDLLLKSYELLEKNTHIKEHYQTMWEYIHIDEYQDTNDIQYKIAKILSEKHQNICVVGDSDQNIYSWRGANIKNILNFEKDFPGAYTVVLEQNYRSTNIIIEAAQEIIRKNEQRIEKTLRTDKKSTNKIKLYQAMSETDEAHFVAEKVSELIRQGVSPKKIAVLFRTNFQSRVLEESFLGRQLPYHVLGVRFFDRKEVKDILAYIRAALNRDNLTDIARIINIPKRGIGKASIAKIFAHKTNELSAKLRTTYEHFDKTLDRIAEITRLYTPSEIIKYVIIHSGIEAMLKEGSADDHERLANIQELVTYATRYDLLPQEQAFEMMMQDIALLSDQDTLIDNEGNRDAVLLMTIHASKGLEFDYVFIVGLEEGLFPSERQNDKKEDTEEERRLMYVAITRAREQLYLSYAYSRRIYGEHTFQTPSRFIDDIPDHLLEADESSNDFEQPKTVYLDW